ncbi:MAG: terminase large subunit domain-containing protein, partial [Candidatus Hodarchaeales archaeon]
GLEEIFFGGARGGGKTDWLIGDFLFHWKEFGDHVRGILFRRTYPALEKIIDRCREIYSKIPGAKYLKVPERTWYFPGGATLKLRHLDRDDDPDKYQGHDYSWIAFDDVTLWPDSKKIDKLRACLRSPHNIYKRFLSTGNPGGPGHNWVKARYISPAPPNKAFWLKINEMSVKAKFIPSKLSDNIILDKSDPDYRNRLAMVGNPEQVRAWLEGDWDIVAGGMFDDIWVRGTHVIEPFEIPSSWFIDRSFDWGASKPFSVGWWAESDGTLAPNGKIYARGTLFRIAEWYGVKKQGGVVEANKGIGLTPKEIAKGIIEREKRWRIHDRVYAGPADRAIFSKESGGESIANQMEDVDVDWDKGNSDPGSRVTRWQIMRTMFKNSLVWPMEEPGLFFFNTCVDGAIRTVPSAVRDDKKTDDIDTNSEDHALDEIGYRVMEGSAAVSEFLG